MSKAAYRREEQLEDEMARSLRANSDKLWRNKYPMAYAIESWQSGDGTLPLHFIERTSQDNTFSAKAAGMVPPAGPYSRSETLRMHPDYPGEVSVAPHLLLAVLLLGVFMLRR